MWHEKLTLTFVHPSLIFTAVNCPKFGVDFRPNEVAFDALWF